MAKNFRIKLRTWVSNGKRRKRYQVLGPDPKTGKEISYGTYRREKDASGRMRECVNATYNLTEFGRMETRTVADLASAFLKNREDRVRWTVQHRAWHERGKSFSPETLRAYRDSVTRHIVPKLGDIVLIALELNDVRGMVAEIGREFTGPLARRAGEVTRAMLKWGDRHDWAIKPQLINALGDLLLPPKQTRKLEITEAHVRAIFGVAFGPRAHKVSRAGYLYRRVIWTLLVSNGTSSRRDIGDQDRKYRLARGPH